MNFVDHIVWDSRTKHSYKRTVIKLNCDFIKELKIDLFWKSLRWFKSLDKAPIFCAAFLRKILMWPLKVSLLSMVIPSIFSSLLLLKMKILKIESFILCILTKAHVAHRLNVNLKQKEKHHWWKCWIKMALILSLEELQQ